MRKNADLWEELIEFFFREFELEKESGRGRKRPWPL
jgi:hypothetical protein